MINFLKSKPFLITSALFSLIFIMNVGVTDFSQKEIILAIFKSLLAGIIFGVLIGGVIYLIQKKNKRNN